MSVEPPISSAISCERRLRDALGRFATGVTVVTTCADGKLEGVTVNSFSALSLDPPLVLWALRKNAASMPSFWTAGAFAINILSAEQQAVSRHFATRSEDKFADIPYEQGYADCPVLPGSIAHFGCRTESHISAGDHVIFIGVVEEYDFRNGTPLIFSTGRYCAPQWLIETEAGRC